MQTLNVNFNFQNNDTVETEVEPDTILRDAWQQLVDAGAIKPLPKGETLLMYNSEGQNLDLNRSVSANNVKNGDTVMIAYEPIAGIA